MKNFFFDTANIDFIKNTWNEIKFDVEPSNVIGITTNPSAFSKLNKLSLKEWFDTIPLLCELVSNIRNDNKGIVYVQGPLSNMSIDELVKYSEILLKLTDGNTSIGLKIPPYSNILKNSQKLNEIISLNVTGISDSATAAKCLTFPVDYISIIVGRMEEMGINAKYQVSFINQCSMINTKIITGSMRTIEGLIWAFQYNTVPTIGEKIWNLIRENNNLDNIININYNENKIVADEYSPFVDKTNYNLSKSFFEQMDFCGQTAYFEFKTGVK